ncbi:hypothetical protein EYF80_020101 [Liparis tanakae]|uniref:Uncharacterized protein n=1 Tax=Liparis tanakae TaxID=230148 RepID=A0A4Z2HVL1_9TELE|nr:hypothetical protein EYF80_020101 [Liparis tanakae]
MEPPAELPESQPQGGDRTDLPPAHKPAPPPPKKKNSDMKGHLTSDDIQVVHLGKDEEMQKLPLQPPYYDIAPSESTPFTDKPNSGHKDCDVQYAELDTAALASTPSPRSSAHTGPGDLVEHVPSQLICQLVDACYRQRDSGRRPEELLNPAEYMSYQRVCNTEHFPESQAGPAAYPPSTFLPQHPYAQNPPSEPTYSNTSFTAAPGPRAPFTFPKEQSSSRNLARYWSSPEKREPFKSTDVRQANSALICWMWSKSKYHGKT